MSKVLRLVLEGGCVDFDTFLTIWKDPELKKSYFPNCKVLLDNRYLSLPSPEFCDKLVLMELGRGTWHSHTLETPLEVVARATVNYVHQFCTRSASLAIQLMIEDCIDDAVHVIQACMDEWLDDSTATAIMANGRLEALRKVYGLPQARVESINAALTHGRKLSFVSDEIYRSMDFWNTIPSDTRHMVINFYGEADCWLAGAMKFFSAAIVCQSKVAIDYIFEKLYENPAEPSPFFTKKLDPTIYEQAKAWGYVKARVIILDLETAPKTAQLAH